MCGCWNEVKFEFRLAFRRLLNLHQRTIAPAIMATTPIVTPTPIPIAVPVDIPPFFLSAVVDAVVDVEVAELADVVLPVGVERVDVLLPVGVERVDVLLLVGLLGGSLAFEVVGEELEVVELLD
jgi:hypothetical protein